MVDYINSWAKGIVIAVIVGTIIEMILPKGNNRKYIKTIIGIYILFVIIYPIISSLTNKKININSIIESTYTSSNITQDNIIELNTNKYVEDTYIKKIKEKIIEDLCNKKYKVEDIVIIVETKNENKYGEINNIEMKISKINSNEKSNKKTSNVVKINSIEKVDISFEDKININEQKSSNKLNKEDTQEIKKYLIDEYLLSTEKIKINE